MARELPAGILGHDSVMITQLQSWYWRYGRMACRVGPVALSDEGSDPKAIINATQVPYLDNLPSFHRLSYQNSMMTHCSVF